MTNEKLLSATDDQISKVLDASIGGHGFWLVNHKEIIEKMISDRIEKAGVSQTMMDVGYSWLRSEDEPYSDLELDMYEAIAKYNGDIDKEGRMTKTAEIYKVINRRIRDQKIRESEKNKITPESEGVPNSKNKEIDSELITKTLEERTPEQIAAWNAQGGAPALLDAYWAGLDDKQRGELIQYVRYYNEANYNTDVFFDHDTGAIDDLESHNIEFIEEKKFEALGLTDEVKREYQTLWTMLNDQSVDQPYRLANISELELETHFNKLQHLLNNEQDQPGVSNKNIEQFSINELQEELLDIETRAENLNLKLTDAQREQIQSLPPEGRRYILDSLENVTPASQVSTNFPEQNQVETDLDMEIF